MRVMVIGKAGELTAPPTPEAFAAMDAFIEELARAGVFIAGAGLQNSQEAKRVLVHGAERTVIDGPFAETRELIAGFQIWEVRNIDEALEWAKRCPAIAPGRTEIEIRPFFEAPDLSDYLTPEDRVAPRGGDRGRLGVA